MWSLPRNNKSYQYKLVKTFQNDLLIVLIMFMNKSCRERIVQTFQEDNHNELITKQHSPILQ